MSVHIDAGMKVSARGQVAVYGNPANACRGVVGEMSLGVEELLMVAIKRNHIRASSSCEFFNHTDAPLYLLCKHHKSSQSARVARCTADKIEHGLRS